MRSLPPDIFFKNMSEIPIFSIFSAVSEIFVTLAVLYVVISNLKGKTFNHKVALVVIIFEFSVNMVYMITRMNAHSVPKDPSIIPLVPPIFFAIHGVVSLLVFILFVVYAFLAYRDSKRGKAYFQNNPMQTYVFLALWMFSVLSGEYLFFKTYF